jgi:hypothetical protein
MTPIMPERRVLPPWLQVLDFFGGLLYDKAFFARHRRVGSAIRFVLIYLTVCFGIHLVKVETATFPDALIVFFLFTGMAIYEKFSKADPNLVVTSTTGMLNKLGQRGEESYREGEIAPLGIDQEQR